MNSRNIHPSLHALFALTVMLPLGCDTTEGDEDVRLANSAAALELSPSQDLVDDPDVLAFEAVDDAFASEVDAQALGAGCTLLRPVSWSRNGHTCVEYYHNPALPPDTLPMYDGESFIIYSNYLGNGSARVTCNNGAIVVTEKICTGEGGSPL